MLCNVLLDPLDAYQASLALARLDVPDLRQPDPGYVRDVFGLLVRLEELGLIRRVHDPSVE